MANGTVYVSSNDGHLYAFDGKSGMEIWKKKIAGALCGSLTVTD
ncbi:PQQ-binding-like beta-propeller repeat protein [Planctomycetota bacterium]